MDYMDFEIRTQFATNTTSRNAFYQTIFVVGHHIETGSLGKAFTHFGSLRKSVRPTADNHRPVSGGRLTTEEFDASKLSRKFQTKLNGDYQAEASINQTYSDENLFRTRLTELFGAAIRDSILIDMQMRPGATASEPIEIDEPTPTPVAEDSLLDSVIASELDPERETNRGSW